MEDSELLPNSKIRPVSLHDVAKIYTRPMGFDILRKGTSAEYGFV